MVKRRFSSDILAIPLHAALVHLADGSQGISSVLIPVSSAVVLESVLRKTGEAGGTHIDLDGVKPPWKRPLLAALTTLLIQKGGSAEWYERNF